MRIVFATIFVFVMLPSVARPVQGPSAGRIKPPAALKCDRSDLTLYDGRILVYRRRRGKTFLRVRTNYETTEDVTIRHPGTDDPSKFYLLNGAVFTRDDWDQIEKTKGVLKDTMRANVWVCRGKPSIQPVVDWKPEDTGAYPRSR
jgi:hypothetical protein